MDIDLAVPNWTLQIKNVGEAASSWAATSNMRIELDSKQKGKDVLEATMTRHTAAGGDQESENIDFVLQLVNVDAFDQRARYANRPIVDLDVNNITINKDELDKRIKEEADDLPKIVNRCMNKKFTMVKHRHSIEGRVTKMLSRGWAEDASA